MAVKKPLKWIWIFAAILIPALGAGGYLWFIQKQPQQKTVSLTKVTLGISDTSLLPSLVHVAVEKEYFLEHGIDIEVIGYPTGRHAFLAALNGEIDMATVAGPPIVFKSFERDDFSIISTIVDSLQHTKALARKDRNISSLQDLVGKNIGTTRGTSGHFFMDSSLVLSGIDSSDIELVNLTPKKLVEAITSGDLDAIFSWEPNTSLAGNKLGDNAVFLPDIVGYTATFNLVSLKSYIAKNPRLLTMILRSLVKAEDFVEYNRDTSIDIVARAIGADRESVDEIWGGYNFRVTISQSLLAILEDQASWAINSGLSDKTMVPNYLDNIYIDALMAVKPEAVTLIR